MISLLKKGPITVTDLLNISKIQYGPSFKRNHILQKTSGFSRQMSDRERFAKKILAKKSKILFFCMFYLGFLLKEMSDLLIPLFLVSDVSESLWLLTKNEQP